MFNIVIKDAAGSIVAATNADRYLLVAQDGNKFVKSFSAADFVEQFGLVEFAKEQLRLDMARTTGQNKEVK